MSLISQGGAVDIRCWDLDGKPASSFEFSGKLSRSSQVDQQTHHQKHCDFGGVTFDAMPEQKCHRPPHRYKLKSSFVTAGTVNSASEANSMWVRFW